MAGENMKKKMARRRTDPVKRLEGMSPKLGMIVLGIGAIALWVALPQVITAVILMIAGAALIFMGEK
jgi:uncharacterized membrane protein